MCIGIRTSTERFTWGEPDNPFLTSLAVALLTSVDQGQVKPKHAQVHPVAKPEQG